MKLIDILVSSGDGMSLFGLRTKYLAMDPDGRVYGYTEMPTPGIIGWSVPDNLYSTDGRGCLIQIDRDDVDGQWQSAIITREQYEAALAAKNDGWIEWGGGECPVPRGTLVDVKYRCGDVNYHTKAGEPDSAGSIDTAFAVRWSKLGAEYDIIAYRLHQSRRAEQPEASEEELNECIGQASSTAWSGRWLPSAGCECEYQYKVHGSEWCSFECVAVDGNAAFGWSNNTPIALQLNTHNFRPMRSNAERKRDAAKNAIAELCRSSASNGHSAYLIYDAIAAGEIPGVKLED